MSLRLSIAVATSGREDTGAQARLELGPAIRVHEPQRLVGLLAVAVVVAVALPVATPLATAMPVQAPVRRFVPAQL